MLIIIWLLCSFASYGFIFAYVQGRFALIAEGTRREDMFMSALFSLGGPVTLTAAIIITEGFKYGWRLK